MKSWKFLMTKELRHNGEFFMQVGKDSYHLIFDDATDTTEITQNGEYYYTAEDILDLHELFEELMGEVKNEDT